MSQEVLINPTQPTQPNTPRLPDLPHSLLESQLKKSSLNRLTSSQWKEARLSDVPKHLRDSVRAQEEDRLSKTSTCLKACPINLMYEKICRSFQIELTEQHKDFLVSGAKFHPAYKTCSKSELRKNVTDWLRPRIKKEVSALLPDVTDWQFLSSADTTVANKKRFMFRQSMHRALIDLGYVRNHNKSKRGGFLEANLMSCSPLKEHVNVEEHSDGKYYASGFSCNNPYSLCCSHKSKVKGAKSNSSFLIATAKTQECKSLYDITFTLPQVVEAYFTNNPDELKRFVKGTRCVVERFMVQGITNHEKINLAMYEGFHLAGSNALMKDRGHIHYAVLGGIAMAPVGKGKVQVRRDVMDGFVPKDKLVELNADYLAFLNDFFEGQDFDKVIVNVGFADLTGSYDKWENQVRNKLEYIARSFSEDFLDAPVLWSRKHGLVVIPDGEGKSKWGYVVLSIREYTKRWTQFVDKENRSVKGVGILNGKKAYGKLIGVEYVVEKDEYEVVDEFSGVRHRFNCKTIQLEEDVKNPQRASKKFRFVKLKEDVLERVLENGDAVVLPPDLVHYGRRGAKREWRPEGGARRLEHGEILLKPKRKRE